jgi:cobalt/nickel transport system permease protein
LLAGYMPYQIWGGGRWRRPAIFLGAMLSVMVSALLALSELLVSGVAMPATALRVSIGLFMIYGLLEGAITVAVLGALESMNVGFLRVPEASVSHRLKWVGLAAILLATFGALIASAYPDGIQRLTSEIGLGSHGRLRISTPLANYEAAFFKSGWLRKAAAGLAGVAVIYSVCALGGRILGRQRGE